MGCCTRRSLGKTEGQAWGSEPHVPWGSARVSRPPRAAALAGASHSVRVSSLRVRVSVAWGPPAPRPSQEDCCPGLGSPPLSPSLTPRPPDPVLLDPSLCEVSSEPALTTTLLQWQEGSVQVPPLTGCRAWRPRGSLPRMNFWILLSRWGWGMETGTLLKIVF